MVVAAEIQKKPQVLFQITHLKASLRRLQYIAFLICLPNICTSIFIKLQQQKKVQYSKNKHQKVRTL